MILYLALIDSEEDRSKFTKIYMQYRYLMYSVAHKILHHTHDAEDAVHQAFEQIAKHIEKIDDPICPKTRGYVVLIVENKSIDILRWRQRHPDHIYSDETTGIDISIDVQRSDTLAYCMSKLPARQRELLLLKHKFGYTSDEIAQLMGISKSNAQKIHQRAKQRLVELCKKEGLI